MLLRFRVADVRSLCDEQELSFVVPEDERAQREGFTTRELSGNRARRINELLRVADLGVTGAESSPSCTRP